MTWYLVKYRDNFAFTFTSHNFISNLVCVWSGQTENVRNSILFALFRLLFGVVAILWVQRMWKSTDCHIRPWNALYIYGMV